MRRSLGRFKISGILITICIGFISICIQKILEVCQEVFIIGRTFINRMKGLGILNWEFPKLGGPMCILAVLMWGTLLYRFILGAPDLGKIPTRNQGSK